jgi:hypothetical protein
MTPRSPDARKPTQPVVLTASISNNTDKIYSDLQVQLERGAPIDQQNLLDDAIETPPSTDQIRPKPLQLKKPLLPQQTQFVTYRTTPLDMCMCFSGVYPYALTVEAISDPSAGMAEVGRTQVFVPSFPTVPEPVTVGWVWPLIERPHRSFNESVFLDDELAGSISPGGRLNRALQVAEKVAGRVRLTVLIDPDLIDSLTVMAAGYQVKVENGSKAGTGGPHAAEWLARLKAVSAKHDIALTAYGDPDIDAVTRAGMFWSSALEPEVQARVNAALPGIVMNNVSWPADGVLTNRALDEVVADGASTVLLSDTALPGQNQTEPRPDALSPLPAASGKATALVTDSAIEQVVASALKLGATPAQDQQTLLAQLAIRAAQSPGTGHFVVIAPDRYVDTDPANAAATIMATRGTTWSGPISIPDALSTVTPIDRGPLQLPGGAQAAEISSATITALGQTERQVASLRETLQNPDAAALLGGFSAGIQRAESNGWRRNLTAGSAVATDLRNAIGRLHASVHLVKPTSGAGLYSLSSSNSPLVVTVANGLPRDVLVRVAVGPGVGVVGFTAAPIGIQTIPANSRKTISIPTHTNRLGKFRVVATMTTPAGTQLGDPVILNVRASSLGGISKTITALAAGILVLALLRRLFRRTRNRNGNPAPRGRASSESAPWDASG